MEALDKANKESAEIVDEESLDEVLTLDTMRATAYVNHPKVGEETDWLTIVRVSKSKKPSDMKGKDREGVEFSTALEYRGGEKFAPIVIFKEGQYNATAWENWLRIQQACKMNNAIEGTKIKIKHVFDGMKDRTKQGSCYEVYVMIGDVETLVTIPGQKK